MTIGRLTGIGWDTSSVSILAYDGIGVFNVAPVVSSSNPGSSDPGSSSPGSIDAGFTGLFARSRFAPVSTLRAYPITDLRSTPLG